MINSTTDQNDPERIIKLSNNIAELDAEYNNWLQNPFDRRKVGDTKCLAKYGCTNTELYNRIRSKLLAVEKPKETVDVSVAVQDVNVPESFTFSKSELVKRLTS